MTHFPIHSVLPYVDRILLKVIRHRDRRDYIPVSEGRMLPYKTLQYSGPGLVLGSLDAESQQKSPFLQIVKYKILSTYEL